MHWKIVWCLAWGKATEASLRVRVLSRMWLQIKCKASTCCSGSTPSTLWSHDDNQALVSTLVVICAASKNNLNSYSLTSWVAAQHNFMDKHWVEKTKQETSWKNSNSESKIHLKVLTDPVVLSVSYHSRVDTSKQAWILFQHFPTTTNVIGGNPAEGVKSFLSDSWTVLLLTRTCFWPVSVQQLCHHGDWLTTQVASLCQLFVTTTHFTCITRSRLQNITLVLKKQNQHIQL